MSKVYKWKEVWQRECPKCKKKTYIRILEKACVSTAEGDEVEMECSDCGHNGKIGVFADESHVVWIEEVKE